MVNEILKTKVRNALMNMRVQEETVYDEKNLALNGWKLIRRVIDQQPIYIGSNKYKTVQHVEIFDRVVNILEEKSINYQITEMYRNYGERKNSVSITFTLPDFIFDVDGSPIAPTIDLINSNDGKMNLRLLFGAWRVKCRNGMVIGEEFANIRVKHIGDGIEFRINNFMERTMKTVEILKETLQKSQDIIVDNTFIEKLRKIGFPEKIIKTIHEQVDAYSQMYKEEVSRDTLWSYYAMLTNWITHQVYATNIVRGLYLQTMLWRLVRNQIRGRA